MSGRNPPSGGRTGATPYIPTRSAGFSRCQGGRPQSPRARSTELLGARGELIIEHAGQEYRLRLTRSGKLILTK